MVQMIREDWIGWPAGNRPEMHEYPGVAPPVEAEDDGVVPPPVLRARQMALDVHSGRAKHSIPARAPCGGDFAPRVVWRYQKRTRVHSSTQENKRHRVLRHEFVASAARAVRQ
jgi:hypothetical protein